tara:strand:- start:485 stop:688 length:204 start_codon:yes stop_codon:yes gene_type:complete
MIEEKYVPVYFKGAKYMCVEGSERARLMRDAYMADRLGYNDMAMHLHLSAMTQPGDAHEHRMGVRHG